MYWGPHHCSTQIQGSNCLQFGWSHPIWQYFGVWWCSEYGAPSKDFCDLCHPIFEDSKMK
jgi:hypothetical protein